MDSLFPDPEKIVFEKPSFIPRILIGLGCVILLVLAVYFYQTPKTIASQGVPIIPYESLPETISFSKPPVFHPMSIKEDIRGPELAKEVGNKIKELLLPYKHIEAKNITSIVSYAVREIIQPKIIQQVEIQPVEIKVPNNYGPLNVANLPLPFNEEEEDVPEKEKKGKIL